MTTLAISLCLLGVSTLSVLLFNMNALQLPILFIVSMLPLFFGGSAWATKDSAAEKEKISLTSRLFGAALLLGVFIYSAQEYWALWSTITDIWKQVLLVWFAVVSSFLFWIVCKGNPKAVKNAKTNKLAEGF